MTQAMPEIQQDGLDVSAEEQRFLRRAFRRFALPYLVVVLAAVGVAAYASSFAPTGADSTALEFETLVAEAASLREAIAAVRNELRAVHNELREQAGQAATRLDAVENGVAKLSADVQAASEVKPVRMPMPRSELISRMEHAHQRINALERSLSDALEGRLPEGDPLEKPEPAPTWPPASPSLP